MKMIVSSFARRIAALTACCLTLLPSLYAQTASPLSSPRPNGNSDPGDHRHAEHEDLLKYYGKQIYFTRNQGQFGQQVLYRADFPLGQAVATKEGMVISTFDPDMMAAREAEGHRLEEDIKNGLPWRPLNTRMKGHTWRMNFVGASPNMKIESKQLHTDVFNYFKGDRKTTNAKSYGEVWYNNVYDNVDVRYYPSADGLLEYDIVCKPGFDKNNIAVKFDGIERMHISRDGHLVMSTSVGDVDFPAPVVYQKIDGNEVSVAAKYIVSGNELRFDLGDYDTAKALIIDPIALRWATWVNTASTGDNHGHCIWVDPTDGAIYMVARVVGTTDQITPGAFDVSANGNLEMIVGKYLEPASVGGSGTRVWQTYIGGDGDDNPYAMEQGPDGNLYITGYTSSSNFPLIGGTAFNGGGASINQSAQTTDNIFITKINKLGNSIKSSVIGGNGDDGAFDLRINSAGDIVICGNHNSNNLATLYPGTGAANRASSTNGIDVIVFKINSDLSSIAWMKNYGGSGTDQPTIMLQNLASGDIFLGGYTTSGNFPTTNPRQSTINGTQSGFLQKLNASGNTIWSSYFQSAANKSTQILCMEFNTDKTQLYFGGITNGLAAANVSAAGVFDNTYNSGTNDFFVCRMDTNQNFVASTYIGGSSNEVNMMGLNTDQNNDVYVFGYTNSTNFPVSALPNTALQATNQGQNDKVFFKLNYNLASLIYSTYYGGSGDDYDPVGERGIKFSNCRIYTIVTSASNNIPLTQGALNTARTSTGVYEPGLVIWANPPDLLGNTISGNQTVCAGTTPGDITGSVPSYVLPTIVRNGTTSSHPSFGSAATYQWQTSPDSIAWTNIPGATNQNLPGSNIGAVNQKTYIRRVIGGDACILAGAADQVVQVKIISVSAIVHNVSCTGFNDGSLVAASDGVAPFTYQWAGGQTTQSLTNLSPGTYSVTVTDNAGCVASNSFQITEPASLPSVTVTPTNPTCPGGGSNGTACATGSGGTPGFMYSWSNGGATQCINNLPAGEYFVTATDANGCTASNSTTLVLPGAPVVSITGDLDFCQNGSTTLDAGAGFNAYAWSTGATTQTIVVTTAEQFTVTVTNADGCTASSSVNTTVYTNPVVEVIGDVNFCNGDSSVLDAGEGFDSYNWSNGETTQTINVSNEGSYNVSVTNENGCTATNGVFVTVFTNPVVTISGDLNFCEGSATLLDAGAGFESYIWNNGETTQTISVNTADEFSVVVTDENGCTGNASVNTSVYPNPVPVITGDLAFCEGSSIVLDAGADFNSYVWNNGQTTQSISVNDAAVYSVVVTDANGCSGSAEVATSIFDNPVPTISGELVFCNGDSTVLNAGAGFSSYHWSNGELTQTISVNVANQFSVTVTDANGCSGYATVNTSTNPLPAPNIEGSLSFCESGSTTLDAGDGFTAYSWSNGATIQTISVGTASTFGVTVTNENGCTGSDEVTTFVNPNLTPNIIGEIEFCEGDSTVLNAGAGYDTYLWSNGSTEQTISVNDGDTYSVTVSDNNGCSGTDEVVTLVHDNPVPSIGGDVSFCAGNSTSLSATAGFESYNWSNGETTQSILVNDAAVYSVVVTDSNGCTGTASVNTTVNQNPTPEISGDLAFCNGSATVLDAGAPYDSYLWNTSETTQTISVSNAAVHTVVVTDANGCSGSAEVLTVINQNPAPVISGGLTFCAGSNTSLDAGAGYSSYSWSNGQTTQTVSVSIGATFTVIVTDQNGCSGSASATTSVSSIMSTSESTNDASACAGICDGSATVTINGGVSPYAIVWSNGATGATVSTFCTGTYTYTVTDAYGCTLSDSSTLVEIGCPPPNCTLEITHTNVSCNGKGSATATVLNGSAPYTYQWSNGKTTQTITNLYAGSYSVTVTSSNGCSATGSVTILPFTAITAYTSCVKTCPGQCAGTASVTVISGGTAPYTYQWSNGATTSTLQNLCAGIYWVTITDVNGCKKILGTQVTGYPLLTVSGSVTNINCTTACTGAITQTVGGGGAAPFTYIWNDGATTKNRWALCAGSYSVTVTSSKGCTATATYNIVQSGSVSVSLVPTNPLCSGGTGSIASTVSGDAAGPFAFIWSNGATTSNLTGVGSGSYSVTVTSAAGCSGTASASIVPPAPVLPNVSGVNLNCYGTVASAAANPSGGTAPYTYLWSNGKTTQTISNLGTGTYVVTVTDQNNCTATGFFNVSAPPKVTGYITCVKTCVGQCNGSATATPLTGTAPYTYQWSNGSTTSTIQNLCAGVYWVTITDANGCKKIIGTQVTTWPPVNIVGTTTNPSGICNGTISQTIGGGGGAPFSYAWSDGGATTKNRWGLCAGIYTVTVTSSRGCTATKTYSIGQGTALRPETTNHSANVTTFTAMAYPNPFATVATIEFERSDAGVTTVDVYTISGVKLATIFDDYVDANVANKATFDATRLPSGIYLYRVSGNGESVYGKITLVK